MINILYVHGLRRTEDADESRTATALRYCLDPLKYKVIAPIFPSRGKEALISIQQAIIDHDIQIVVASSLGGFLSLLLRDIPKIVINPCCNPFVELNKLGFEDLALTYNNLLSSLWENIEPFDVEFTYGVFGMHDELFSYKCEFEKSYKHALMIDDGHRISIENVRQVISPLVEQISISKQIR